MWTPIGSETHGYRGRFNGNGRTISGIYINDATKNNVGLFGYILSLIDNITVANSYIKANSSVGGICGWNYGGLIVNCLNSCVVSGNSSVGGVCGYNESLRGLENCINSAAVIGSAASSSVGGVCGKNNGTVLKSYNTGAVRGNSDVGGVCGRNLDLIMTSYNIGTVTGTGSNIGGLCGYNEDNEKKSTEILKNCFNTGTVTGSDNFVGGFCGVNTGTIINCFYLEDCAKDGSNVEQNGIGNETKGSTQTDVAGSTNKRTAIEFADCTVQYELRGGVAVLEWFQGYRVPRLNLFQTTSQDATCQIDNADDLFWLMIHTSFYTNVLLRMDIDINPGYIFHADGTYTGGTSPRVWDDNRMATIPARPFVFDGNGKSISGLYSTNETKTCVGLFGKLQNGNIVKNTTIANSYLEGSISVGGVCGFNSGGTITNCLHTGAVRGQTSVGGVCGANEFGTLTDSANTGAVGGRYAVGGVCGRNTSGKFKNCYNTGTVTGISDNAYESEGVGGVCGVNQNKDRSYTDVNFMNSYNTGTVTGVKYVGGVCGLNTSSAAFVYIRNCYNLGTVNGTNFVGSVCGDNGYGLASVQNCYYLAGSASVANMPQNGMGIDTNEVAEAADDVSGKTESKTIAEFADGSITFALNGGTNQVSSWVWYQKLTGTDKDDFPTLTSAEGKAVYYGYENCNSTEKTYSNELRHTELPTHSFSGENNGICPVCGAYQPIAPDSDGIYQIGNAGQLFWFAEKVNSENNAINGKLSSDINLNPNYTFTFDPDTGLVAVTKGNNTVYLGTGIKGDATGGNIAFDSVASTSGSFYSSTNSTATGTAPKDLHIWTPIGSEACQYTGTFEGNSKIIEGICFIDGSENYVGLFGYVGNTSSIDGNVGTIRNITMSNTYINGFAYSGGVCGYNSGTISGCQNSGIIIGIDQKIGGICGYNSGTISGCLSASTISGSSLVGGLCGENYNTVGNCYNTGSVNGTNFVGGVCGVNYNIVENCYNIGSVNGTNFVGGVCGENDGGSGTNCYYLSGCATNGNGTVQYGIGNNTLEGTTADTAGFTNGKSTTEMQGDSLKDALGSENWIYITDEYPQLKSFVVTNPAHLIITAIHIASAESNVTFSLTFTSNEWEATTFTFADWLSVASTRISVHYSTTLDDTFESRLSDVSVQDNGDGTGTLTGNLPQNTTCAFFRIVVE